MPHRMVKDDRIGHSHRFGGKMNSAFRGIASPGNGDLPVKGDIRYTPRTAYAQPTIPRRCNPTRRLHVVGEVLKPDGRRRLHKPDAANQRPAHVVVLRPEDMLYPDPKP